MTERAAHVKLAVDIGSDPITGSVTVNDGESGSFCGWIELVAAIESARHDGSAAEDDLDIGRGAGVPEDLPLGSGSDRPAEPALG